MLEYEVRDALQLGSANEQHRWPRRGDSNNRLEPECWPAIKPRFHIEPNSTVFTIGSCFARNIEYYLAEFGVDVPVHRFFQEHPEYLSVAETNILNRYTPPSIHQELAWTGAIRERDDTVRMEDIEPFLLELRNGNVMDLQRRQSGRLGLSRAEALAQRQLLYRLFRQAFDCDLVVLTLGHIECWWDNESRQYVDLNSEIARLAGSGRFYFRRIDYPQAYQSIRDALELLNADGTKRVLLTTSPIPIARTFTGDDVVIANSYSKAVLRAVAGRIVEELPWVDYFPSFESVLLTKREEVWEDDLIHVRRPFIGRIMGRVVDSYFVKQDGGAARRAAIDAELHFINLANAKRFDDAATLYENSLKTSANLLSSDARVSAAEMFAHLGRTDEALATIIGIEAQCSGDLETGGRLLWQCAGIYELLDQPERAAAVREQAYRKYAERPLSIPRTIAWLRMAKRAPEARWLAERAEREPEQKLEVLLAIAAFHREEDRAEDFERVLRRCTELAPGNEELTLQLGTLLVRRDRRAACELFEAFLMRSPHNRTIAQRLAHLCIQDKRWAEAERWGMAAASAGNANGETHHLLGRCAYRLGRLEDARVHMQAAVAMEPEKEAWQNSLAVITAALAKRGPKSPGPAVVSPVEPRRHTGRDTRGSRAGRNIG